MTTVTAPAMPPATASAQQPRTKQLRTVTLVRPLDAHGENGIIRITEGRHEDLYLVDSLLADFGDGFALDKYNGDEVYHVCLAGQRSTCECKGFLRHHHCRHIEGLQALKNAGKL